MGLRHASVRHPNVVVMAPALTEAAQSHNFRLTPSSRTSRLPLSLRKFKQKNSYKKRTNFKRTLSTKSLSNGIRRESGMNGHSPPKITYSINGLAKTLKNEFIPIEKTDANTDRDTDNSHADEEISKPICEAEGSDYTLTQIGGFIMNSGFSSPNDNQGNMGLQKSNKDLTEADPPTFAKDKVSQGEVDQLFKNLGVVISNDDLSSSGELGQNVEEILQVINSMENNGGDICPSEMANLESGPSVEPDPMFPMPDETDFERDLFNVVNVMGMCVDENLVAINKDALVKDKIEEARKKEFLLQRKCEFLMRRLHKIQARAVGKQACEEITGVLEYAGNLLESSNRTKGYKNNDGCEGDKNNVRTDSKGVSMSSMSLLMRQLEHASTQQANSTLRSNTKQFRYFGSGSSGSNVLVVSNGLRPGLPGSVLPPFKSEVKLEVEQVAGEVESQLSFVRSEIDSDVTASSSGCESCDEFITYNNPHQHQLTISKRVAWRYAEDRAGVGCRWTWLQAQMADLEYKIRQQNEIRRQLRAAKGNVILSGDPLPKGSNEEDGGGCSRTRGLMRTTFGKRKLVQMSGLHKQSKKAARPATLRCTCRAPLPPCALCTGRDQPTSPKEIIDVVPLNERIAHLDPGFHPQLSFSSDISQSVHYDALLKCPEWQSRAIRIPGKSVVGSCSGTGAIVGVGAALEAAAAAEPDHRRIKKHHHLDHRNKTPTSLAISTKLKRNIVRGRRRRKPGIGFDHRYRPRRKSHAVQDGDVGGNMAEGESGYEGGDISRFSPVPSPTPSKDPKDQFRRKRENSYDIDNIVIPYSIAASTRPEKLHYKEILTPKWRRVKDERSEGLDHKNGVVRRSSHDAEGEEDIGEDSVVARHDRCEVEEKKKFLSYLKLPNSGMGRGRGQRRTDSRAESSGANTPDPMSPGTKDTGGEGGSGENNISPLTSPPATPGGGSTVVQDGSLPPPEQSSLPPSRRRTVSQSKLEQPPKSPLPLPHDVYEVSPYEPRVFPLSEDIYNKMLSENETQPFSVIQNATPYKHYELQSISRPGTPNSFSTDSAESYVIEDPNDPEWTMSDSTVDRLPNKR